MSRYETYKRPKKIESICTICKDQGRKFTHKGWTKYEYCRVHKSQIARGDYLDTMSEASFFAIHS